VEDGETANFTRVLSVWAPERCTLPDDTLASEYGIIIDATNNDSSIIRRQDELQDDIIVGCEILINVVKVMEADISVFRRRHDFLAFLAEGIFTIP